MPRAPAILQHLERRAQRLLATGLLLLLVGGLVWLKAGYRITNGYGIDGRYYLQLARHIQEGDGLVSSVSLYHQGFRTWPHRVNQTPLWPLMLGAGARLTSLDVAGRRLPELLWVLDLFLVYALANRLWNRVAQRPAAGWLGSGVPNLGHAAVLLIGTNPVLFRFTSAPYSEALGFALAFGGLLALDLAAERGSARWAALCGVLCALAVLTRGQLVVLLLAVLGGLVLAARGHERGWRLPAMAAAMVIVVFAPWIAYLASWVPRLTPTVVLGFATVPEALSLPTYDFWVTTDSLGDYLWDRGNGLLVAFTYGHRQSYSASHGPAVYLLFAALAVVAVLLARCPRRVFDWFGPQQALVWAMLAIGIGTLLPVHHAHAKIIFEWLFGHRHGLPLVFLLIPAMACLFAQRLVVVRLATAIVVGWTGIAGAVRIAEAGKVSDGIKPPDHYFARWIDERPEPPIILTTKPTNMAYLSRGRFHWTACMESADTTRKLIEDTGVEYVAVFRQQRKCPYFVGMTEDELYPIETFGHKPRIVLFATKHAPEFPAILRKRLRQHKRSTEPALPPGLWR